MVEIYQKRLVARDLISQSLATRSTQGPGGSPNTAGIQAEFNALYTGHEKEFKEELLKARDELGVLLADVARAQSQLPDLPRYRAAPRRAARSK